MSIVRSPLQPPLHSHATHSILSPLQLESAAAAQHVACQILQRVLEIRFGCFLVRKRSHAHTIHLMEHGEVCGVNLRV